MAKIDKTKFTKAQWKKYKQARNYKKEAERERRRIDHSKQLIEEQKVAVSDKLKIEDKAAFAFVIGNGTSRESLDLEKLKSFGKIYACNAVYREFEPDYLVAVDTKMIIEINKYGYQHNHEVWTNPNKAYTRFKNFNYFHPSKGWSSGPTALWLSSQHGYPVTYILGFDYKGIGDNFSKVNNIYADTQNYKNSSEGATFYGNWMRQTTQVIKDNPQKRYIRVIKDSGFIPKDFAKFTNLEHITVEEFKKIFNLS